MGPEGRSLDEMPADCGVGQQREADEKIESFLRVKADPGVLKDLDMEDVNSGDNNIEDYIDCLVARQQGQRA